MLANKETPTYLIGNKCDLPRQISSKHAMELSIKVGIHYLEISCIKYTSVHALINAIRAIPNIKAKAPEGYKSQNTQHLSKFLQYNPIKKSHLKTNSTQSDNSLRQSASAMARPLSQQKGKSRDKQISATKTTSINNSEVVLTLCICTKDGRAVYSIHENTLVSDIAQLYSRNRGRSATYLIARLLKHKVDLAIKDALISNKKYNAILESRNSPGRRMSFTKSFSTSKEDRHRFNSSIDFSSDAKQTKCRRISSQLHASQHLRIGELAAKEIWASSTLY